MVKINDKKGMLYYYKKISKNTVVAFILGALFVAIISPTISFYVTKFLNGKDFSLKVKVCAPLGKVEAYLVNVKTGEKTPLNNAQGPNPILVQFENNGNKPISNFDLYVEFETNQKSFSLQNEGIGTLPEKGFGEIKVDKQSQKSRKIHVELMNPGDRIHYSADANYPVKTLVYSKTSGLSYNVEFNPSCDR